MTETPDTPTYYVVHALPDGSTRALYPVQLLTEAAGLRYPHEARSWEVPDRPDLTPEVRGRTGYGGDGRWLVLAESVPALDAVVPTGSTPGPYEKRPEPIYGVPRSAFDVAPPTPPTDDQAHYDRHGEEDECAAGALFAGTYYREHTPNPPRRVRVDLTAWRQMPGEPDPRPQVAWRADPAAVALYGEHVAHLLPGRLYGLRRDVMALLEAHPWVDSVSNWTHRGRGTEVCVSWGVEWSVARSETRMERGPRQRKARPVEHAVPGPHGTKTLHVEDHIDAPDKATALAELHKRAADEAARFLPNLGQATACAACDGLGVIPERPVEPGIKVH